MLSIRTHSLSGASSRAFSAHRSRNALVDIHVVLLCFDRCCVVLLYVVLLHINQIGTLGHLTLLYVICIQTYQLICILLCLLLAANELWNQFQLLMLNGGRSGGR